MAECEPSVKRKGNILELDNGVMEEGLALAMATRHHSGTRLCLTTKYSLPIALHAHKQLKL